MVLIVIQNITKKVVSIVKNKPNAKNSFEDCQNKNTIDAAIADANIVNNGLDEI